MTINRDDFYITLFSDASKEIYTLNSHTSFTNRLALPVDLGSFSDWVVGLVEISYKPPERMIDLTGEENFFVYCYLVAPQLVGSELKSLLRTIIAPSQTVQHMFPNIYGSTTGVWPTMLQAAKRGASSLLLLSLTNTPKKNTTFTVCRGWRYCPTHPPLHTYTPPSLLRSHHPLTT